MIQITTKLTSFTWIRLLFVLSLSLGITSACSQEEAVASTSKTSTEALELGTDIKNVVKKSSSEQTSGEVKKIMWEDLIPSEFKPEVIVNKYKAQVDKITEGEDENSTEAQALMDKIMAEFNNAPANKELDGVKVKIPGFVAMLDEKNGVVSEFLLVPYFGSCIHSPPPPVNQTVLVITNKDKSISVGDVYEPVWVTGVVKVERKKTDLAQAGYIIQNAELEIYKPEDERPATE